MTICDGLGLGESESGQRKRVRVVKLPCWSGLRFFFLCCVLLADSNVYLKVQVEDSYCARK